MTRKLIIHDGHSERELVLIGTIVVGRDPACHITDLDPLLSRRHAEFVTTPQTVTIRDLGSRNGMLVNGAKVREQILAEGDLVQLGHLQVRYVEDHTVETPESIMRAHATTATAMDAATRAAVARPASTADLEDTKPHPPHAHAAPDADADVTRAPGHRDPDATFVPGQADEEETMAPGKRGSSASAVADLDATFAPAGAHVADPDATFVAGAMPHTDLDATFVPGMKAGADLDATFAPGAGPGADLDATFAAAAVDVDATFVPRHKSAPLAGHVAAASEDAQLVADRNLRVTTASAACREMFGAAPDALVDQTLGDLIAKSLQRLAAGDGPSSISFVVERSPSNRTLTLTIKAGQAIETVS